jgi:hypothetical protein
MQTRESKPSIWLERLLFRPLHGAHSRSGSSLQELCSSPYNLLLKKRKKVANFVLLEILGATVSNPIFKNYLLHLVPAFAIPAALYLFDQSIPLISLCKIGLLFPLLMLAMKGLSAYFPPENLRNRSFRRIVEYALLHGLVFAAFMVVISGFSQPNLQLTPLIALRQFLIGTTVVSVGNVILAVSQQKKLRS